MTHLDRTFDAVMIGDCIEHMRKSVGVDLLNFLVYRSKIIIVKFPLQMIQTSWQDHKSEAHISIWSEHDFRGMDYLFSERNFICLALVRGYLNQLWSGSLQVSCSASATRTWHSFTPVILHAS